MTMTTTHAWPAAVSPRVPEPTLACYPAASQPPQPHTAAELGRLIQMLRASRAETIAIGHGRHTASAGAADAMAAAWTAGVGQVLAVVDWPAAAAVKTVCLGWYWQPCQYTRTARDVNGQPVARSPAGSP